MALIASGVEERQIGAVRLLLLRTGIQDVVTVRGSLASWPRLAAGEELLQDLAVSLLDRGTSGRDRMEIASLLEDRGAGIGFSSDATHVRFSARLLSPDVETVFALLGEQLQEPALDESEFVKARQRIDSALTRAVSDAGHRSSVAFSGAVLPADHPGYIAAPQEEREALAKAEVSAVRSYHASHVARGPLTIVVVGDLDADRIAAAVERAFGSRPPAGPISTLGAPVAVGEAERIHIEVADRPNLDVRLGHALPLRRSAPDFLPLFVGNYVLGGNFSSRLMTQVRDEKGLTYGVGSALAGINAHHDGTWRIAVGLSSERLDEGIEASRDTLRAFVTQGASAQEVDTAVATLKGQYVVGLATTGGIASTLRSHAENGFPVSYIDTYPDELASVDPGRVNESVRRHLHPERLVVASAGTIGQT